MKIRKIAAAAAACAFAASAMCIGASAAEYNAFLMFTDYDWAWGNWDAGTAGDAVVNGPGTYTVSVDAATVGAAGAANGAQVFCVDIVDAYADLADYTVTLDSITADGNEVSFDADKINYGDIEEKGTYRIEIFNVYGETGKSDSDKYMPIDSEGFSAADKIEVTFTISGGDAAEEAPSEEDTAETEAPAEETEAPAEETEAPAAETEAPAEETQAEESIAPDDVAPSDSSTSAAATGNASAGSIAAVMAVAAAAAAIVKKIK